MEQHSFISPFLFLFLPCLCTVVSPDFPLLSLLLAHNGPLHCEPWHVLLLYEGQQLTWVLKPLAGQGPGALTALNFEVQEECWVGVKCCNQGQIPNCGVQGKMKMWSPLFIWQERSSVLSSWCLSWDGMVIFTCDLVLCSFGLESLTTRANPHWCLGLPLATWHMLDPDPPQVCVQIPCQEADSWS